MSLLDLMNVSKRYGDDHRARIGLDDVSLSLDAGELVAVWGTRRSGRSTLLRIAAGIEPPDSGIVRYGGRELGGGRLVQGIAYCRRSFPPSEGRSVLEQLLTAQEALGMQRGAATASACVALERVGLRGCAQLRPQQLDAEETTRVVIARALTLRPGVLVIDEPTIGVDASARDAILQLLRSLADDGLGVLMSTGDTPCLSPADRALAMSNGKLRGDVAPNLAQVVRLRPQSQPAA